MIKRNQAISKVNSYILYTQRYKHKHCIGVTSEETGQYVISSSFLIERRKEEEEEEREEKSHYEYTKCKLKREMNSFECAVYKKLKRLYKLQWYFIVSKHSEFPLSTSILLHRNGKYSFRLEPTTSSSSILRCGRLPQVLEQNGSELS